MRTLRAHRSLSCRSLKICAACAQDDKRDETQAVIGVALAGSSVTGVTLVEALVTPPSMTGVVMRSLRGKSWAAYTRTRILALLLLLAASLCLASKMGCMPYAEFTAQDVASPVAGAAEARSSRPAGGASRPAAREEDPDQGSRIRIWAAGPGPGRREEQVGAQWRAHLGAKHGVSAASYRFEKSFLPTTSKMSRIRPWPYSYNESYSALMIAACKKLGMKPVCEYPRFCENDAQALYLGQKGHISFPHSKKWINERFPSGWGAIQSYWEGLCSYTAKGHGNNALC